MVNPPSSVSIQIVLGRRLLSVTLTSFVPTIILILVLYFFVSDQGPRFQEKYFLTGIIGYKLCKAQVVRRNCHCQLDNHAGIGDAIRQ